MQPHCTRVLGVEAPLGLLLPLTSFAPSWFDSLPSYSTLEGYANIH